MVDASGKSSTRITRGSPAFIVAGALCMFAIQSQAQQYSVVNIGTCCDADALNASGQVTGSAQKPDYSGLYAFIYSGGAITDIDTLGYAQSYGYAINSLGQVAGYGYFANGLDYMAFLYSNGKMTALGTLSGGTASYAQGLNDSGQVVGYADVSGGTAVHAFLYSQGTMTDLGTLSAGGDSSAYAINASGQVAGQASYGTPPTSGGSPTYHAFLYSNGKMNDLGTLGGSSSAGYAINADGQVVGWSYTAKDAAKHAFITNATTNALTDLGSLGGADSEAGGINASGVVVGFSTTSSSTDHVAFVYRDGQMFDLNTLLTPGSASQYEIIGAVGINDAGQIAADGYDSATGDYAALLLTPVSSAITLSATSLAFGNEVVNGASAPKSISVTNTGAAPVSIKSITLGGSTADDFSLTNTCGSSLAAGTSCTISATFKPVSAGGKSATISISDNASGSPQSVAVSGTGVAAPPPVTLSARSLAFGNEAVNATSAPQSITVTNTGTAPLSITSIALSGSTPADFSFTKTCGASLATGASCMISVTFKPVSAGGKAAVLSIADNASGSPQTVALSGIGVAEPTATLSTSSLAFGSEAVSATSASKSISLTNSGAAPLSISSITLSGSTTDDFAFTKTCGASLASGASCMISVTFKPVSAGGKAAVLSVADNASGSPQSVALRGTGVASQ
jgi:probable HAF family extracellular repeat protein